MTQPRRRQRQHTPMGCCQGVRWSCASYARRKQSTSVRNEKKKPAQRRAFHLLPRSPNNERLHVRTAKTAHNTARLRPSITRRGRKNHLLHSPHEENDRIDHVRGELPVEVWLVALFQVLLAAGDGVHHAPQVQRKLPNDTCAGAKTNACQVFELPQGFRIVSSGNVQGLAGTAMVWQKQGPAYLLSAVFILTCSYDSSYNWECS